MEVLTADELDIGLTVQIAKTFVGWSGGFHDEYAALVGRGCCLSSWSAGVDGVNRKGGKRIADGDLKVLWELFIKRHARHGQ